MFRKVTIILMGLGLVVLGCMLIFKDAFGTSIERTAEAAAVNAVASKINASLKDGFYSENFEESLLYIERDGDGNIQYVEPNSKVINRLLLSFSANVKENYDLSDIEEIKVNYGVVTGSRILSQLPFYFKVKVHPVSLTKFQYETGFETQGINQTRYCVYCTITSEIQVIAPFTEKMAQINRRLLLAEAVIVGNVPDSYVVVPEENILDVVPE